ncbi:MAG: hypothetical protein OQJ89_09390 [Kangiellaceae bacterium]|nr:hypothetical protein [Kangiellaceae bacterium]MCW8999042.1 hypothetical protein [Kangiellaceae bacterium]MCW9017166.1 hypothetical protein [Kangiellaceae bacterium]
MPLKPIFQILLFVSLFLVTQPISSADQQKYLEQFFTGSAVRFGYGSGISSNSPRVELTIHYCPSGAYFSSGQSCRPNIIAKGYQCSSIQDMGQWKIVSQSNVSFIQWYSQNSGPGSLQVFIRNNGSVVDSQGNPFVRIGTAQCR